MKIQKLLLKDVKMMILQLSVAIYQILIIIWKQIYQIQNIFLMLISKLDFRVMRNKMKILFL